MIDRKLLVTLARDDRNEIINKVSNKTDNRVKRTETLKLIIARIGWPTIPLVGAEASYAAWLIAQHSDHDLNFQKCCLSLMAEPYRHRQIDPADFAYLTDRVAVNSHQPQIYATQWETLTKIHPIKNIRKLDELRLKVGLAPYKYSEGIRNGTMSWEEICKQSPVPVQIKIGCFDASRL